MANKNETKDGIKTEKICDSSCEEEDCYKCAIHNGKDELTRVEISAICGKCKYGSVLCKECGIDPELFDAEWCATDR